MISDSRPNPILVVARRYEPDIFYPAALIIPETQFLFVGAGISLIGYKLDQPHKVWEDEADTGFWGWARYGLYVLMSAELELVAWDIEGNKLWTTFVEPPWYYSVENDTVFLDVMGRKSSFPLRAGPAK
jgi:hypothetical protein